MHDHITALIDQHITPDGEPYEDSVLIITHILNLAIGPAAGGMGSTERETLITVARALKASEPNAPLILAEEIPPSEEDMHDEEDISSLGVVFEDYVSSYAAWLFNGGHKMDEPTSLDFPELTEDELVRGVTIARRRHEGGE